LTTSDGRVGIAVARAGIRTILFAPDHGSVELCNDGIALIRNLVGQSIPVRGGANNPLNVSLFRALQRGTAALAHLR
jgi:hypothetical protein